MQVIKDGQVYDLIDNTGSTDEAALGARYAMGRLDTLDGRFNGYYTKTEVLDLLTGMASTYIVAELPATPDANTYYMVGNDSDGYVLHYYDHELEHAIVGSYELDLSAVSPQKATLPPAGADYAGKVYQYIGTTQARYTRGKWYECRNQTLYAWLHTTNAWVMYTYNETPVNNEYIYNEDGIPYMYPVRSLSGNTLTDMNGDTWTRNSGADSSAYLWFDLANGALSSVWDTDLATGKVVTTTARGKLTTTNVNTGEVNYLSGVTSNIQTQLNNKQDKLTAEAVSSVADATKVSGVDLTNKKSKDTTALDLFKYMMNKMYPVGSIYITTTSTNPGTTLGVGTWSIVATDRVLWGVASGTAAGSTLSEQLPNIKGQATLELTNAQAQNGAMKITKKSGSREPNWSGDNSWGYLEFDASKSSSTYKDGATVRPAAYTVHIWKRTA
jgi:hypothetical protein